MVVRRYAFFVAWSDVLAGGHVMQPAGIMGKIFRRLFIDPVEPLLPVLCGFPRIETGIPEGQRLYVIGDIHGCADLLSQKHQAIDADIRANGTNADCSIIYLGDYIDGGPASREVVEMLLKTHSGRPRKITLMGNHERMLLDFLDDPRHGQQWLDLFGRATLESYGVPAPAGQLGEGQLESLRVSLKRKIPASHVQFFNSLETSYVSGDYAFVHAGIRPGVPLAEQARHDLLWIRDDFLVSRAHHEKVIVHGHTYTRRPRVRARRIALDTGSFFTGRLSCLVLQGKSLRLL